MDTSDVAGGVDRKCSEEAEDVTVRLPHSCIPEKSNRTEAAFLGFGIDLSGRIGYYKKRTDVHYLEVRNGD